MRRGSFLSAGEFNPVQNRFVSLTVGGVPSPTVSLPRVLLGGYLRYPPLNWLLSLSRKTELNSLAKR
jgi:hypothetical protein